MNEGPREDRGLSSGKGRPHKAPLVGSQNSRSLMKIYYSRHFITFIEKLKHKPSPVTQPTTPGTQQDLRQEDQTGRSAWTW